MWSCVLIGVYFHCTAMLQIFEIDSTGTAAYLILRGAVRMYSKASSGGNDGEFLP
jgi:hypothetical protein